MLTPDEIISLLNLEPHLEGGYFAETYRCDERLPKKATPARYSGERCLGTAIYYLLTRDTISAMHRLLTDEIFHFYLGDPVEMLHLYPDGSGKVITIGQDLASGMHPQVVIPGGVWQGARVTPGGRFALLGTTMAPGFEFADYEAGSREGLVAAYPEFGEMIEELTSGL